MSSQNNKESTGYPSIDKHWLKYYSEEPNPRFSHIQPEFEK